MSKTTIRSAATPIASATGRGFGSLKWASRACGVAKMTMKP